MTYMPRVIAKEDVLFRPTLAYARRAGEQKFSDWFNNPDGLNEDCRAPSGLAMTYMSHVIAKKDVLFRPTLAYARRAGEQKFSDWFQ
jgi:hypothetical protein